MGITSGYILYSVILGAYISIKYEYSYKDQDGMLKYWNWNSQSTWSGSNAAWPRSSGIESLRRDRFHHMVRRSSPCPLPEAAKHGSQINLAKKIKKVPANKILCYMIWSIGIGWLHTQIWEIDAPLGLWNLLLWPIVSYQLHNHANLTCTIYGVFHGL